MLRSWKIENLMMICIFLSQKHSLAFRSFGYIRAKGFTPRIYSLSLSSSFNPIDDRLPTVPNQTPWNRDSKLDTSKRRNNKNRFRQHVNPLTSQHQLPAVLSDDWPSDVFHDTTLPLHLDIGCGKGGFLLEIAEKQKGVNYLGIEIRSSVTEFAQRRVDRHGLTGMLAFLACNANVDLHRILERYRMAGSGSLSRVSIQFPDPHFKKQHLKRRVVNSQLVHTIARHLQQGGTIFLQSDVQDVLDDMRSKFREAEEYFIDDIQDPNEYLEENFYGIPTEREISVLERNLPVYRTVVRRTTTAYEELVIVPEQS
jgi:tRNA (guanine-N7-)-methyltransferase